MKSNTYLFLILSVVACSCSEMKDKPVRVSEVKVSVDAASASVPVSEIASSSLLLLPTNDSLIIDEINHIHNTSEYICLSDVSAVYQFTYDGRLVNQLRKQGSGADEYLNVSDFSIDSQNNLWILSRTTQALFKYNWEGNLLKKLKVDLWPQNICLLDDDHLLLYTGNEENSSGQQLHLLNVSTGQIEKAYKPIDKSQASYLHVKSNNMFRRCDDRSICFHQLFNDTVYHLTPEQLTAEYVVNWDGHNIPRSYFENDFQNIMEFFQDFHGKGIYAYGFNCFVETEGSYWISYYYQKTCACAIVPKREGKPLLFTELKVDALQGYPVVLSDASLFVQDDGSIVLPVQAMNVKEYWTEHNLQGEEIPDDSNPYLLIVRPKE